MTIEFKYIEETNGFDKTWNQNLKKVEDLHKEKGRIIPNPKDDSALSNWLSCQRRAFLKGSLAKDREASLRAIGFSFEKQVKSWEESYADLVKYKKKNKHCDVPYRGANKQSSQLGSWVHFQREYKRQGTLTSKQIKMLEKLGFKWSIPEDERYTHGSKRGYAA